MSSRHLEIFKFNFFTWKIFGLWPGRKQTTFYNYYSFFYLFFTLAVYNVLLTLNLVYTPRKIELLIREVIFYFTEIAVTSKVLMIILMRHKIVEAFELIDEGRTAIDDELSERIVAEDNKKFMKFVKMFSTMSNFAYFSQVLAPVIVHLITKRSNLDLPICKYYFLTDEIRDKYFIGWFIYQSIGMYGHMMYNVTIDTFVAGMLLICISQLKILNTKLRNLKLSHEEKRLNPCVTEKIQVSRLRQCLLRYDAILYYCKLLQKIIDITMFVVFGISALIICTVLCGLIMPSSTETFVFMIMYLFAMTLQIFLPAYLGSQLYYESKELVFAAYCTEWIPRSESFKKSIIVFVQRANVPIELSGLKMFSLSLSTFTSIMKSAYSFFALVRSFQDG